MVYATDLKRKFSDLYEHGRRTFGETQIIFNHRETLYERDIHL